jgi:ribosomal protein S4E
LTSHTLISAAAGLEARAAATLVGIIDIVEIPKMGDVFGVVG